MPRRSFFDDEYREPDLIERATPHVRQMMRWCQADDERFNRALAALWNRVILYDEPVREWRELARAPIGAGPNAVEGRELALFVGLMIGVMVDFAALKPKPAHNRRRKPPVAA